MQIEVNEQNIREYGLDQLTENTTEQLLERAAEATKAGFTLTVTIPDNHIEQNVFNSYSTAPAEPADPALVGICNYALMIETETEELAFICQVHGMKSKYITTDESNHPCLALDPIKEV